MRSLMLATMCILLGFGCALAAASNGSPVPLSPGAPYSAPRGNTCLVAPDGSGSYPTIQAAIDAAAPGDTILLADGTFTGAGNRDIDYNGRAITVRSASGIAENCVIDCEWAGRGFSIHCGEGPEAVLQDVTITHGTHFSGHAGAINIAGSQTRPLITGCIFRDNTASGCGGAICTASGAAPRIDECFFYENRSTEIGGAICWASGMEAKISGCIFAGNTADSLAGALYLFQFADTIAACTFYENSAPAGSGIALAFASMSWIRNCIISHGLQGEAIRCVVDQTPDIACCDLYGNAGGDWIGTIAGELGFNGNTSEDPLYCNAPGGDFHLRDESPCAPFYDPACELIGALPVECGQRVYTVCPDGSGDFLTIQEAIDAAWYEEDVVELCDGTFTGAGNRDLDFLGKAITVRSASGVPEDCIIDCEGAGRGFDFHSGEGPESLLEGVTITNGIQSSGGAVRVDPTASPTIVNCILSDNWADMKGGAAYCQGRASFTECIFANNAAGAMGGAAHVEDSVSVSSCTFYGNSAPSGCGLHCGSMTAYPTLDHTILAFGIGGPAITCQGTGAPELGCCDIYGNAGGDWVGCIAGQFGISGNFGLDPVFCNAAAGDFSLRSDSPCAPYAGPDPVCGLIGARDVGCICHIFTVCPDGSDAYTHIADAVSAAASGDTIELCDMTFSGDGNYDVDCRGKSLLFRSRGGDPLACIIDCGFEHRGFHIHQGETLRIEGITITHGDGGEAGGGAVLCDSSSALMMADCILLENSAPAGGAVRCRNSSASLTSCCFQTNSAEEGAAACLLACATVIDSCSFEENSAAYYGGAVSADEGVLALRVCEFASNVATGADYVPGFGGAVVSSSDSLWVIDCTLAFNQASDAALGGAPGYGGAVYPTGPYLNVSGSTFHENEASRGGGIYLGSLVDGTIANTIISASLEGEALYCTTSNEIALECCDLYNNAGGDWIGSIAGLLGVNGNICTSPIYCDAMNFDLALRDDSPCAAENNPACGQIGAWPVGCTGAGAVPDGQAVPLPAALQLHPSQPNPACHSAALMFDLPRASRITLSIHDPTGRRILQLEDERRFPAGRHQSVWNGRDALGNPVSAGIYFCRLEADGAALTRRITLLR